MNWLWFSIIAIVIVALTVAAIFVIWKADAPQVYLYYNKNANPTSVANARNIAASPTFNGVIATPAQVQAALTAGAEWCAAGWASDGNVYFPMQTTKPDCGAPGINKATCAGYGNNCGVLIYGKKPSKNTANVLLFNETQWSQWKWYDPFHS